jgi:hypothetical protein
LALRRSANWPNPQSPLSGRIAEPGIDGGRFAETRRRGNSNWRSVELPIGHFAISAQRVIAEPALVGVQIAENRQRRDSNWRRDEAPIGQIRKSSQTPSQEPAPKDGRSAAVDVDLAASR